MGDAGRLHGNVAGEVAEFLLRRYFQCDVGIVAGWKSAGCNSLVQASVMPCFNKSFISITLDPPARLWLIVYNWH